LHKIFTTTPTYQTKNKRKNAHAGDNFLQSESNTHMTSYARCDV